MAPSIASTWRSFWHELTSNDRHAGPEAAYRGHQHQPLPRSRSTPLTSSAATGVFDSRTDLDHDLEAGNGGFVTHSGSGTTTPTYRTSMQRQHSGGDKLESLTTGEIQMQSFSDGLPPPPPVSHSWKRIDRWMEDNYEELFENIGPGATINDVNELEHELDCTLPQDVRESLQLHDGQERGGMPTGVIFGCMLLDCEEITQEWQNWRTVNEAYFSNESRPFPAPQPPLKAFAGSSSSAAAAPQPPAGNSSQWRAELLDKQDSQPPNAIHKAYAHPAWIPLARDWGGNNIAVDLAPGPAGKWGQIILMGRDYDCKYVVARSWAAFLATLADDLSTDKWWIEEDSKELKLREFKQPGVEPAYIDILRWRTDQKYGRRAPRRRPLRVNSNVTSPTSVGGAANGFSPYASPVDNDRGRSPHRYSTGSNNGKAPATSSPRAHIGSPLARVTEESSATTPSRSDDSHKLVGGLDSPRGSISSASGINSNALARASEKLISLNSEHHNNIKLLLYHSCSRRFREMVVVKVFYFWRFHGRLFMLESHVCTDFI
ncbi:cell wall assembly and cell proliferation coordinating protein [Dissoconium aciculare CBS 342.82]|uniref:Cell wall assembly and cell proliferation coordinating protein n=1 Tax=Dissoconium aciculare CBS 342.82 TaxID=1314786 RepID=A0A6J3M4S8_9PEZI|nr:cell wall assembly and cell proliferation coordinating protein [Dissoconium aciculare CBS 342.82]KAF1823035.1 cell wall assembly and cell proliferation coordinating protein [Dissoconium aciculare CBS 342.82]